jgi:antitoxin component YwqK of YwqJK toxin-antitoxin module
MVNQVKKHNIKVVIAPFSKKTMGNVIVSKTINPSDNIKTELFIRNLPPEIQFIILHMALATYHNLGFRLPKLENLIINKRTSKDKRLLFPHSNNYQRAGGDKCINCPCSYNFKYKYMIPSWNNKYEELNNINVHNYRGVLNNINDLSHGGVCFNNCRPIGLYNKRVENFLNYETDQSKLYTGWVTIFENNYIFEGRFSGGMANVFGYEFYESGGMGERGNCKYKGIFKDGMYDGIGEQYDVNGNLIYCGEFENGLKSGHGCLYNEDRDIIYNGEFNYDKKQGFGNEFNDLQNLIYTGDFLNGKRHGHGTENYVNDTEYLLINYRGMFKEGLYDGWGTEYVNIIDEYSNVTTHLRFEGEYSNGLRHGLGQYNYINGKCEYIGNYLEGQKTGFGVEFHDSELVSRDNSITFVGSYSNGLRDGLGAEYPLNGNTKYIGIYLNGNRHRCLGNKHIRQSERTLSLYVDNVMSQWDNAYAYIYAGVYMRWWNRLPSFRRARRWM